MFVSSLQRSVRTMFARMRRPARIAVAAGLVVVVIAAILAVRSSNSIDPRFTALARRGDLLVRLSETGSLRPAESLTYRSPLGGRETEITFLAPEGIRVNEGDLLARVDTTDLDAEIQRARQAVRQAEVDVQMSEVDHQEAQAALESLTTGEKALEVDQAKSNLALGEKKVERLKREYESLKPLLDKGFITQEELDRAALELEQAQSDIEMSRRKAGLLVQRTRPQEEQRAKLQMAQRDAQLRQAQQKRDEATQQLHNLETAHEACSMYAKQAGLVVYEEYLNANPRRKIRVGDRVTASQGLITIPEVSRMLVESSVREADVYRLHNGQTVTVRVDAYPELRLTGRVVQVGTLARTSVDRPLEDKRFDFVVELDPNNADLRPEMTVRMEIVTDQKRGVLLVPANAIFDRDGMPVVFVVGRWRTETRHVRIGQSNEFDVEILDGLREQDRVSLTDLGGTTATSSPSSVPTGPAPKAADPRRTRDH